MNDESILAAGGSLIAALALFFMACVGHANPVKITYRNPGQVTYDTITINMPGLSPQAGFSGCAPGQSCNAYVCAPPGEYVGITATAKAGGVTSPVSNQTTASVPVATACSFDFDRSGTLTVADYGAFLGDFWKGCWTVADFGVFLSGLGKPCK